MKIITRKIGEEILIGNGGSQDIKLTIVHVRKSEVKIGIDAPANVRIDLSTD